ncbi:hypothetical protein [Microbacterium sp. 1.5R]|uniref:hypothetical protein n=1 Tax=Microbacterium sp. 1.5R TaxID=1916917 RepID=UPI0016433F5D|nr:hypothetical protein [Microbacterium sp. 1.5R]
MKHESAPQKDAPEDLAGGLISPHLSVDRFTPRRISSAASAVIDGWITLLTADQLSLAALPPSLFSLYNLGVSHGRLEMSEEVRAAKLDADRLWLRAFGEEDRKAYLLSRLNDAADLANQPDVDDVLDEAWRVYLASLENVRHPIRPTTTEESSHEHAA